jgi:hypothetical protein
MSAYKLQMPGNYSKESIQHLEHSESSKSRRQEKYGFSLYQVDGTPGHPPSSLQCPLIYFLTFPTHNYRSVLPAATLENHFVQLLTSQVISKSWTRDSRFHCNDLCTGSLLVLCGVQFYPYFCLLFVQFWQQYASILCL